MGKIKRELPKTLEEFVEKGWLDHLRYRIRKFTLNDILNDTEDIIQDMLYQMATNKFIENYDPTGRDFEVYINVFVTNHMCRRYKKERGTRHGYQIVNRKSVEFTLPDNPGDIRSDVVYLDAMTNFSTIEGISDADLVIKDLKQELTQFKPSSFVEYQGEMIGRDPLTVLNFILEDKSVAEIADIFDTSRQFIYNLIKKIRSTRALSSQD